MTCSSANHKPLCPANSEAAHNDTHSEFSREAEPLAPDCASHSGSMNCDLLRWAASQELPFIQHSVLVTLALFTDESGRAQISKAQIAKRAGVTDRQVHTILERLAWRQLLSIGKGEKRGRGRPANAYTLNSGNLVPETDFKNLTSGIPIPEANFQNTDFEKPTSRTELQEQAAKVIEAVDNAAGACIGTGARAQTQPSNTITSQIRSDQIEPPTKAMIDALIKRADDGCNPTNGNLHSGAELIRYLRGGCIWEDIEFATDKLAASFRGQGKRFSTWKLLEEHVVEVRDRRVAGLPPPAPIQFRPLQRQTSRGPYRANGIAPMVAVG